MFIFLIFHILFCFLLEKNVKIFPTLFSVKNKRSSFQNAVSKIIQDLTTEEQKYIQRLGRVNLITFPGTPNTGTDGLQGKTGNAKVYVTLGTSSASTSSTATNTLQELVQDVQKIQKNIAEKYCMNREIIRRIWNKLILPTDDPECDVLPCRIPGNPPMRWDDQL